MHLRKWFWIFGFWILSCFGVYADDTSDNSGENCDIGVKYVYVINAASGTLQKQPDNEGDNFTLTLHEVEKDVDWLTARPKRDSGKIEVSKFLSLWDVGAGSFGQVPPNAELVSKSFIPLGFFGGATVHSFVISNPRYDADQKTAVFDAKSLDDGPVKEGIYRNLSIYIAD